MANVYGLDGAAAVTLPNRRRAPNLNRIPCVTENEFVDAVKKSVISRRSTCRGGVRQMVRLLSLKPSLKLKLICTLV